MAEDLDVAWSWYQKSSDLGNSTSIFSLGLMMVRGKGGLNELVDSGVREAAAFLEGVKICAGRALFDFWSGCKCRSRSN